jgi:transketolase
MAIGEKCGLKLGQATRDAFGEALAELGHSYPQLVTVDGDVGNSTRTEVFASAFPNRAYNVGIAESNLVSVGGGLASNGKIPVVASFACFLMCNAYEQIRMSVAFPHLNVKLVGSHAGISIGEDGPSQMGIEDVALARSFPGMVVLVPCDGVSAKKATEAMLKHEGPTYLRLGRPKVPVVYANGCDFEIGKAITVRAGDDVTVIANGLMVAVALEAAHELASEGVSARVVDMHTAKPLDEESIVKAARQTGAIVVAEEHLADGGLGSAVAMVVAQTIPVPMAYVNLGDQYAESGDAEGLLEKYGLTSAAVVDAVRRVIRR